MSKKTFDIEEIREKILNKDDRVFDKVPVDIWDVTVPTISLSMAQRRRLREKSIRFTEDGAPKVDSEMMQIQALIEGCKDHKTEKSVFTQGDAEQLWEKNSNAVSKVANKVLNDSDMDKDGEKSVEEAKNS
jgi:hypothetical protein